MSMTEEHERLREDVAAHALDALGDLDRERLEAHLRQCTECRDLLARYRKVRDLLPFALETGAAPPQARAALLAHVRGEDSGSATRLSGPKARRRQAAAAGGWAAAAVILAALLGWNVLLQRQVADLRHPATVDVEVFARLTGGRAIALKGTGTPGARGTLFVSRDGLRAYLAVDGLAPLPTGRIYQLWFARTGIRPTTGGAFRVDTRGQAGTVVAIPAPLDEVTAIAVTEEPIPGSLAPTGQHLLDGEP